MISDYAHICPGAVIAGNVKIGDASQVGINASLLPGLIIGDNVSIGAGSVILQNVSQTQWFMAILEKLNNQI